MYVVHLFVKIIDGFQFYSKKYIDTIKLAEENTSLREKIKELEEKLATETPKRISPRYMRII